MQSLPILEARSVSPPVPAQLAKLLPSFVLVLILMKCEMKFLVALLETLVAVCISISLGFRPETPVSSKKIAGAARMKPPW